MSNGQNVLIGCKQEMEENLDVVLVNENVIDFNGEYFFIVNVAYEDAQNICSSIYNSEGLLAEMLIKDYPNADYFGVVEMIKESIGLRNINNKEDIEEYISEMKEEIEEYYLV